MSIIFFLFCTLLSAPPPSTLIYPSISSNLFCAASLSPPLLLFLTPLLFFWFLCQPADRHVISFCPAAELSWSQWRRVEDPRSSLTCSLIELVSVWHHLWVRAVFFTGEGGRQYHTGTHASLYPPCSDLLINAFFFFCLCETEEENIARC